MYLSTIMSKTQSFVAQRQSYKSKMSLQAKNRTILIFSNVATDRSLLKTDNEESDGTGRISGARQRHVKSTQGTTVDHTNVTLAALSASNALTWETYEVEEASVCTIKKGRYLTTIQTLLLDFNTTV